MIVLRLRYKQPTISGQIFIVNKPKGHKRTPMTLSKFAVAGITLLATAVIPFSQSSAEARGEDNTSLKALQQQRENVRRQAASKASQVNALKASDAEVTAALDALTANVNAQRDKLDEAERAVEQAKAEQAAAEAAQVAKQKELDALVAKMNDSAVSSFISMDSSNTVTVNASDVNDAVYKRTLMSMQASQSISLSERFRSVQEDLEIQRQAAAAAHERAQAAENSVSSRLSELNKAHDQQQAFADQVDSRLESALAEADALSAVDSALAQSISAKQAAIAKALAAQRAEAQRRAALRAAQNRPAVGNGGSSSGGGGGGSVSITGSGEIVTVGGIRIHNSIANNLAGLLSAASADGISLSGGGFRDPAGQIAVRKNNCGTSHYAIYEMPASSCRPPTARPGSSMHERGLAVDFTSGGRTLTRGSAAFAWMRANAGRFGFQNLPSEPWHWSTNGN